MNDGTKLRTILAIATSLNTALIATDITEFQNEVIDTAYKAASVLLNFIIIAICTYYNNDFTQIASEHTGRMRLEKEQNAGIIHGEDFTDEPEEDEEEDGDGLDPDEADADDIDDGPNDADPDDEEVL